MIVGSALQRAFDAGRRPVGEEGQSWLTGKIRERSGL